MTETNASAHRSRSFPAPWRPGPEGLPDPQTLLLEQIREEELFQRIMEEAKQEKTPLEDLLKHTIRLVFPQAEDSHVERALAAFKARSAERQNRVDRDGNPHWISLTVSERDESGVRIKPDTVRPSDAESAAPPKTDTKGRSEKDRERPGIFKRFWGMFSRPPDPRRTQITPDPIAARKGATPPPRPSPLRGLVRLSLLFGICALVYYALALRGCMPNIM